MTDIGIEWIQLQCARPAVSSDIDVAMFLEWTTIVEVVRKNDFESSIDEIKSEDIQLADLL